MIYKKGGMHMKSEGGSKDTFYLPPEMASGMEVEPGDTIAFKVIGRDKDGSIEVAYADEEETPWKDQAMADMKEMPEGGMMEEEV